jgi:glycosyltransferase involved in cell wall biosynthesis
MINPDKPNYANLPGSLSRACYGYQLYADMPATVSILTPFYNTEPEVLVETYRSIAMQSFQEWEWIVVDDGSTKMECIEGLREIQKQDARIKIVRQENHGPSAARNTAFSCSTGRYICLLDSDDLLEPTFLEKTLWFLESEPEFAFCNAWSVSFGGQEFLWKMGFEFGKAHLRGNIGPVHSTIRREAYAAIGGFDETIRVGHEDWDFWLAMANAGYWGYTLPEYLLWYRKHADSRYHQIMRSRADHNKFVRHIRKKYPDLGKRFPEPLLRSNVSFESVRTDRPFDNRLDHRDTQHAILFMIPWMVTGGADKVNLDWISGLLKNGYRVSVCATLKAQHEWYSDFAALTPDIFVLPNFLHVSDYPRFLTYLIRSRGIDTVMMSNCTLGYLLLPYLRQACPDVTFVDLSHAEEPHWRNGGHPRFGVGYQDQLDLNIVSTGSLRDWMTERGAERDRIQVCYTGIAPEVAIDKDADRIRMRQHLGIPMDMPLLVYAGRLCDQKRPEFMADVLRELSVAGVPFHCIVIGTGDLEATLERKIRKSGLGNAVTMFGRATHREWIEVLASADIFFLPSLYEGISVALYEAMAMQVVPVMSAVGGQREVVTGDCGFLVEQDENERQAYVTVLRRLIEHPDLRQAMGKRCAERLHEGFTMDQAIANIVAALDKARSLARSHPRQVLSRGLALELAQQAIEFVRLTVRDPLPPRLARIIAVVRSYKIGRVILRSRAVYVTGQFLLNRFRRLTRYR